MGRRRIGNQRMVTITFWIPKALLEMVDKLVETGIYPSRNEAIRHALSKFLAKYGELRKTPVLG